LHFFFPFPLPAPTPIGLFQKVTAEQVGNISECRSVGATAVTLPKLWGPDDVIVEGKVTQSPRWTLYRPLKVRPMQRVAQQEPGLELR
jgi:hypothetical protein